MTGVQTCALPIWSFGEGVNPASLPWSTLRAGGCAELLGHPGGTEGEGGWSLSAWARARPAWGGGGSQPGASPRAPVCPGVPVLQPRAGGLAPRPGPCPPQTRPPSSVPSSGKASPPCLPIRRLAGKHPAPDTGGSGREETEVSGNRRPIVEAGLAPQPGQEPFLFRSGLRPSREGAPGNPRLGVV